MNKNEFKQMLENAKKTFPSHRMIYLRIRKDAKNPFDSPTMDKFIRTRNIFPKYRCYIHDEYVSFYYLSIPKTIVARLPINDKLWIELFCVFKLSKEKKKKKKKRKMYFQDNR